MSVEVIHGDCLAVMPALATGSIDMILCDLPYGTTNCAWDQVIPFEPLWEQYERLIRPNGAIVLTASQPFTSALVMSKPKLFRYSWVWLKSHPTGFLSAKKRPLGKHEDILVFSKGPCRYFPQMTEGKQKVNRSGFVIGERKTQSVYGKSATLSEVKNSTYYPATPLSFSTGARWQSLHPTQKPVALFEYLIRTYTEPGELVLDNCAGSGTTGVAAIQSGRRAILIEQEAKYAQLSERRVLDAQAEVRVRDAQPELLGAS